MANVSNWIHLNGIGYLLLLLVLDCIKEPEGSNAHVLLALEHHCLVCRLIIQLYDLCKAPNKSCFISLNHNNGLAQKPTVQHSVPLQIRTTLMASSGTPLLPSPMPIPSITVVLNLMMSLGTTSMPQQWCWSQDLPFLEARRPRTSPSQADIIVAWFSLDWN